MQPPYLDSQPSTSTSEPRRACHSVRPLLSTRRSSPDSRLPSWAARGDLETGQGCREAALPHPRSHPRFRDSNGHQRSIWWMCATHMSYACMSISTTVHYMFLSLRYTHKSWIWLMLNDGHDLKLALTYSWIIQPSVTISNQSSIIPK